MLSSLMAAAQNFEFAGLRFSIINTVDKTCKVDGLIRGKYYPDSIPQYAISGDNKYIVTEIGPYAFAGCEGFTTITIPNSVKVIGNNSFSECHRLVNIKLSESLIEIGDSAFWNCDYWSIRYSDIHKSDIKPLILPDNIKRIGNSAFQSSGHNIEIVNLPNQVETIGDFAFYNCSPKTLEFPSTLTSIGKYAFHGSPSTELQIPSTITNIGSGAFSAMPIKEVTLPNNLREIPANIFEDCSELVTISFPTQITAIGASAFARTKLSAIDIPESVTHIGDSAFYNCNLTTLRLPSKLTKIGNYLLFYNKKLTSVNIPGNVTSIGDNAFAICYNLTEISIPDRVKSIGNSVFFQCHKLTDVTLPVNLQTLGNSVFDTCAGLTSVTMPNSENISGIPSGMFHKCANLKILKTPNCSSESIEGVISIPNGIKSIGSNAFAECTQIHIVEIPASVESISPTAFRQCNLLERYAVSKDNKSYKDDNGILMSGDGKILISYPNGAECDYTIPQSVNEIGDYAFCNNTFIKSVSLPDNIAKIGQRAFQYCKSLHDINFPNSLFEIGEFAFYECHSLEEISLSNNLSRIEPWTFYKCSALTNVTFPIGLEYIGRYAFFDTPVKIIRLSADVKIIEDDAFGANNSIEEIWIYGYLQRISWPWNLNYRNVKRIYYLSRTPQADNFSNIWWGMDILTGEDSDVELYVLSETYEEIKKGNIDPWSNFKNIYTYNPLNDPYTSTEYIPNNGIDGMSTKIYNLNGIFISDTIDNLSPGIYILCCGTKAKKLIISK